MWYKAAEATLAKPGESIRVISQLFTSWHRRPGFSVKVWGFRNENISAHHGL